MTDRAQLMKGSGDPSDRPYVLSNVIVRNAPGEDQRIRQKDRYLLTRVT